MKKIRLVFAFSPIPTPLQPIMNARFLASLTIALATARMLPAASATWNVNADGNWADGANWNPVGAPGATVGTTSADVATFGTAISAARAITVDANRNIAGINFAGNSSAYNLSGGGLVLTSGGTIQTSGAGSGHTDTIASPITIANSVDNGTLSLTSGSTTATRLLVVNGSITGAATTGTSTLTLGGTNTGGNTVGGLISNGTGGGNLAVEKTGTGTWILTGNNTFSGGLTVRAGELRVANPGAASAAGSGTITLGDTSGTSSATLRVDNSFSPAQALVVAAGSSGVKTLTTGNVGTPGYNGSITLNAPLTVAVTSTGTANTNFTFAGGGDINLNANAMTLSLAPVGTSNNATITLNKPVIGTGAILISSGGASSGTRTVALSATNSYTGGTTVGGTGSSRPLVVNVSGNQSAATGGWNIDINNEATSVTSTVSFATGSTVSVASGKAITLGGTAGHFGARTLNAAGTLTNDGTLLVRRASTVNVTGAWTQNGAASLITQGGGQAAMNINTGGSFTYTSGTNFALSTSTSDNTVTNLTVNGGTFTTGTPFRNNTVALTPLDSAFAQLVLNNGGSFVLSASIPQLLLTAGGNIRLALGDTGVGGVVDTNGFSTTVNQPVVNLTGQNGKLVKRGAGSLTLAGTISHTGMTSVEAGTLEVTSASLADGAAVDLTTGATLHLNHAGTDTVAQFLIDDDPQEAGKWGRIGSIIDLGADFETSLITGNGLLNNTNSIGNYHWDGTGTSWAAAAAWSFSPIDGTPDPVDPPIAPSVLRFGTTDIFTDQIVQLNGDQSAGGLLFLSPSLFTFVGGDADHSLTLGGLTVEAASQGPVFGSDTAGQAVNLILGGTQTWSQLSTAGPVTVKNGLDLAGFDLSFTGAGNYDLNGVVSGTGTLMKRGTGTLALAGANTFTGSTQVDEGTVNVSGNQTAATGSWLQRGYGPTGTIFNTVATTGNWQSGSTRTLGVGQSIQLGNTLGNGGFQLQTLNCAGSVTANGSVFFGRASRANLTSGANWTQNGLFTLASMGGGSAEMVIGTGATFTHAGSSEMLVNSSASNNVITLLTVDGGILATGNALRNGNATPATGTLSRVALTNGGTLRLTASLADLFTTAGGTREFVLSSGDGIIDTQSFDGTLNLAISGTGSLVKEGSGTLTTAGTNTYTGNTTVNGGTLVVAGPNLADDSSVTVASGAKLNLNFSGEDVVAAIQLGALPPLGPGLYNATSHPTFFEGTGSLRITSPDPFADWMAGFFGSETDPAIVGRASDPDGDGVPNSLEFLTNGIPNNGSNRGLVWIGVNANQLVLSIGIRGETTTFAGSPSPATTVDGVTATIQGSMALENFTAAVSGVAFVLPSGWSGTAPAGFSYHSFRLDASSGLPDKGFLRVMTE